LADARRGLDGAWASLSLGLAIQQPNEEATTVLDFGPAKSFFGLLLAQMAGANGFRAQE
jgi:hypothetical protein